MIRTIFILIAFQLSFSQNYWQQHVEYEMDINVDVSDFTYDGNQSIVYTNNSNDTIKKVYYHLFFNAFKPNSQMDIRSRTIRDPDRRVGSRIVALEEKDYGDISVSSLKQPLRILQNWSGFIPASKAILYTFFIASGPSSFVLLNTKAPSYVF